MRVLILGAKGNLGTQLTKVFNDFDLFAWDGGDVDFLNEESLHKKIKELKPSAIINAVAYNAVDKCEEDEAEFELAQKLNSALPKNLAQIAKDLKATLVHYSTDYVFGAGDKKYYKEDDAPCPINKYGQTKLDGEINIQKTADLHYYIIRTSKLFGKQGKSEFSKPSFFDTMLKMSQTHKELKVVDEEFSCFTYTTDLALWTKKLINAKKEKGIYHFVNEGACTWFEATKELFKQKNIKTKIIPVSADEFPRPAKRPKYSALLNTKFEKMRNWKNCIS